MAHPPVSFLAQLVLQCDPVLPINTTKSLAMAPSTCGPWFHGLPFDSAGEGRDVVLDEEGVDEGDRD
jgi:hypothetical protein